ncbi:MAG: LPS assembly lipoprotein LptE [Saprospiraceae bacterium]
MKYKYIILLFISQVLLGCYSFKGISIPSDIKTYYVHDVILSDTRNAPPDIPEKFLEQLRKVIRSQSSLIESERNSDIEFICDITRFNISNEASNQNNEVALNKLTISVKVEYLNTKDDDDTWTKTFSFGIPFDPSADLNELQDGFINDIFIEITDQVFNDAFTNW